MPIHHLAPQLVLAVGAVVVLLVALFLPQARQWLCAPLAMGCLSISAASVLSLQLGTAQTLTFSGTWALDGVTAWASYAILATAAFSVALSPRWLASDRRHGEWYVMLLFAAAGATLLAGAADLSELMIGMLLSSSAGYTLASFHRASRMSAEAGAKLYFLGALANPVLFLGIVFLYGLSATTRYEGTASALAAGAADPYVLAAGVALILIGLAFELGAFPVHAWLPDVAQGSPAPAAAFLTVAPKLGALVAAARFVSLLPDAMEAWRVAVALMAAATMTLGNLAALWQEDVRRLLGWSSVSQAGYGLMAVVAVGHSEWALPSLVVFMVGYALANVTAFAVVVGLRGRTTRDGYRGLGRARPGHAAALSLALLSLTGIPPLIGFTAKLALFGAAIQAGYAWLALLAVVNSVVSLFYYLRVIGPMVLEPPQGPVATLGGATGAVVGLASLLVVATGLAAQLLFAGASAARLLPG